MARSKIVQLDRNRTIGLGPVYCEGCGLFFTDNVRTNIHSYHSLRYNPCRKHKGMKGFSLIDELNKEDSSLL